MHDTTHCRCCLFQLKRALYIIFYFRVIWYFSVILNTLSKFFSRYLGITVLVVSVVMRGP